MMEIVAKHTDPQLKKIRDQVGSRNSKTPFLLMPVRIETRFMQTERPDPSFAAGRLVGRALEDFHVLEISFLQAQGETDANGQKKLAQLVSKRVKQLEATIDQIGPVTKEQKAWLEDAATSVAKAVKPVGSRLSDRAGSVQVRQYVQSLQSRVERLDASAPSKTEAALRFVDGMVALERKLALFSSRKLPYTSKAKKKELYGFVAERVHEARDFYENSPDTVRSIAYAEANLVQKTKALHAKIKGHLGNLDRSIKPIHGDKNWINFVDAQASLVRDEYTRLFARFEQTAINHLEELQKTDRIDANQLLVQCLAVKKSFVTHADSSTKPYGPVKSLRKQLKRKMKALESLGQQTIAGDESQKDQIVRLFGEIETARSQFDQKLRGLTFRKGSQRFGLNATRLFLSSAAKITSLSAPDIRITDRTTISDAKRTVEAASKTLAQLGNALEQRTAIGDAQNKLLDTVLQEAQVSLRKHRQFAGNDLAQFNRALADLEAKARSARFESSQAKQDYELKTAALAEVVKLLDKQAILVGKGSGFQFVDQRERQNELWLRIYPDDLFVHTHEKAMTASELESAKRYWKIVWAVDSDKDLVLGAWRNLVASYGSNRAAWVAKTVGALKRAKDGTIARDNPSKAIREAYGLLSSVLQSLKDAEPLSTPANLGADIDFAGVKAKLDAATGIYKQLHDKPQLIYFLEKAISLQQRLHTKFQSLAQLINDHPAATGDAVTIGNVQALHAFEALHSAFTAIKPVRTDQFLERTPEPYTYPDSPLLQAKESPWTVAPHTKVLPKQFVAIGRNKGQFEIIHVGSPIPDTMQLGMDPATFNFDTDGKNPFQFDEQGNLQVEPGMRWMVDFKEAVKKGMGMVIPLSEEQAKRGFDEWYVVGLSDKTDTQGSALLEELLENHHYSATGMEFLKVGTPTNNTKGAKAGYSEQGMDAERAYALEMEGPLFEAATLSGNTADDVDGLHVARLLGISEACFAHIKNSDLKQVGNARAMHKSLWHATLGNYMEDMWDKVFTYDNVERTYQFFTKYVVGRGYFPSLRIGSQPYGILPATSFKHIGFSNTFSDNQLPTLTPQELRNPTSAAIQNRLQIRYDIRLKKLLNKGHEIWTSLRLQHVNHAGNITTKADPQAAFVNMLGLNAASTEYYFRYGVNVNDRTADDLSDVGINFKNDKDVIYSPQSLIMKFYDLLKGGYYLPSFEWDDETDPSADAFKQLTRQNARMKDQVQGSRIFTYRYFNRHSLVAGDLVHAELDDQPLPDIVGDSKNYIQWLLDPAKHIYHDIFNDNNLAGLPSQSVLFLLLRHSMLLSYREAAVKILQQDGFFEEHFQRLLGSKESYMSRDLSRFRTKWTHLLKRIADITDGFYFDDRDITAKPLYRFLTTGRSEAVSDYIHNESFRNQYSGRSGHREIIGRNQEVRDAIGRLANVATEDLQPLLAEHLDVSSYRLDAWLSGLANRRLEESRALQGKGIFLGAYAWVLDLRPGGERKEVATIPAGLARSDDTVFTDEDNEGYMHAPSINHAISAAVLRSGYLSNTDTAGNLTNRMAVNLSSARVRTAMQIIDGLKNGLDLASILGYQFEKGLHERYEEAELDKFIHPLRLRFPLIVPVQVTNENAEQRTSNVVHGMDLLDSITDAIDPQAGASQSSLYEYLTQENYKHCPSWLIDFVKKHGSASSTERNKELTALIKEIDRMADAFDALGDLAVSESVYQIVNGNHVRAASVLAALGDGNVMPEPQVVNTPRTGSVVTHRVILPLGGATGKPAGWEAPLTPRAKAEPAINHWLAEKIGNPDEYYCQLSVAGSGGTFTVQLSELPLQPIDLLFLLSNNKETGNADLNDIIKDTVRYREGLEPEKGLLVDITAQNGTWPGHAKRFYELDWVLHHCKSMLHDARPIGFSDIHIPSENPDADNPDRYDLADTQARAAEIHNDLKQFIALVNGFLESNPTLQHSASYKKAYQFLLDASQYGVTNLLADLDRRSDEAEAQVLLERLEKAVDLLTKRVLEASELIAKSGQAISTHEQVQELAKAVKKVLGEDFPFVPVFLNGITADIKEQLERPAAESLLRAGAGNFPMDEWVQGIADVRSKMYAVEMLHLFERHAGHATTEPRPVQFPSREGDYWLGMEFPDGFDNEEDKLSLVLLDPQSAIAGTKQKGLLVDEWVEIIPNKSETTGIAFQYDQPDARPPQTILLAVSPKPVTATSKWRWDDVVYTLMDTLEMAQNRTVEPDHLEQSLLGQVLPAIVAEVVPPQISSMFDTDDDVHTNPLGSQVVLDFEANLPKEED